MVGPYSRKAVSENPAHWNHHKKAETCVNQNEGKTPRKKTLSTDIVYTIAKCRFSHFEEGVEQPSVFHCDWRWAFCNSVFEQNSLKNYWSKLENKS